MSNIVKNLKAIASNVAKCGIAVAEAVEDSIKAGTAEADIEALGAAMSKEGKGSTLYGYFSQARGLLKAHVAGELLPRPKGAGVDAWYKGRTAEVVKKKAAAEKARGKKGKGGKGGKAAPASANPLKGKTASEALAMLSDAGLLAEVAGMIDALRVSK